ncbi:MAG: hypothetical protein ISQ34_03180 [Rickettsiales bacterium]|nr:hypothetical protein [Rickettsiales bacterium]
MRYSPNLNVIIKAIEKASVHLSRDFMELENLQSNPASANKFASHCYQKVKQILASEFARFRPEFNIVFDDGQRIINNQNPEFIYHISAINGLDNLSRANPNFVVAVILVHKDSEKEEAISVALNNVFSKEIYYCEKGFGSYVNNRKIKVSKRKDAKLAFVSNVENLKEKVTFTQSLGSTALEIAYLASGKAEIGVFDNNELNKNLLLLFKEAGGKVEEGKELITAKSE